MRRPRPRTAIAPSSGRAAARVGGSNSSNPATLVNRPGITTSSVPSATAMLSAASFDWPPFRPDRSRLSCRLELRTCQRQSSGERGQQQQQGPSEPDRRGQRHHDGELGDDVEQKQSRHHEMATSQTAAGVPQTAAARLDGGVTTIEIDTPTGPIDALLDIPDGQGPWPGVVIIHDAIGYGPDKESINRQVAAAGYVALTPNLFARGGRARCITKVIREMITKAGSALDDVLAARDHLKALPECTGRVGIAGFCMGGAVRTFMSPKGFDASAPFYGTPLPRELSETLDGACPMVASFGSRDPIGSGAPEKLQRVLDDKGITNDVKAYQGRTQLRQQAARPAAAAHHRVRLQPGSHRRCLGAGLRVLRRTPAQLTQAGRTSRPTLFFIPPRSLLNTLNTLPTIPYSRPIAS